ncbi:MAG: GHKL domain-containing protein [Woeseiaceae bacterium]|nr:GHKL domain-containing protein [Woeseiaceae bacterium]
MSSLSARLLISVSVLLLFFLGVTGAVLDTAFRKAAEQAREDILDGHLMAILAAAEATEDGELMMPPDLQEPRFGAIGSGLYAEIRDSEGSPVWRSRSALGLIIPFGVISQDGSRLFREEELDDGTPLLTLSIAVQWEFPDGQLRPYIFKVAESLESFNAQVARFRQQLFGWFAAVAVIMLITIAALLGGLLRPLRQIEAQIGEIEAGSRHSLSGEFPTELQGVARNMNLLIDSERARSERYKQTLANLAHSLKTPLAAMRALTTQTKRLKHADRFNEQIDRMDEIVRYQLRKPATSGVTSSLMSMVPVKPEVDRLVEGLRKVYHDKEPEIQADIGENAQFRGDKGDFLEVAGNLLDNACKWCERRVRIAVQHTGDALLLIVSDDGPGIPDDAADALQQRGTRLDESTPGHGIGLAVVKDIARSYGGDLKIRRSEFGGAEIRVTLPSV